MSEGMVRGLKSDTEMVFQRGFNPAYFNVNVKELRGRRAAALECCKGKKVILG